MVKHMVMWSFKEEIPEEKKPELKAQIKEHLEGLVGVVPFLLSPLHIFSNCYTNLYK
jgi:hypothetical protein